MNDYYPEKETWKKDPENLRILKKRLSNRNKNKKLMSGDYIIRPDGTYTRVTHIWGYGKNDTIQTGGDVYGRYYLQDGGYLDYSGGLDSGYKFSQLAKTNKTKIGWVWFFHHNVSGAGRGVDFPAKMRVWRVK